MKGLKYLTGLCILAFMVILSLQSGTAVNDTDSTIALRTSTMVDGLLAAGIGLEPNTDYLPVEYKIGDTLPAIYDVPATSGKIFLYQFHSPNRREELTREAATFYSPDSSGHYRMFDKKRNTDDIYWAYSFPVKNMLVIYFFEYDPNNPAYLNNTWYVNHALAVKNLENLIFYKYQKGRTVILEGQGEFWQGRITLNYWQNFYKDEQGKGHYESWHTLKQQVKYTGNPVDLKEGFPLEFAGEHGSGGWSGNMEYRPGSEDGEGFISLGGSGGNGAFSPDRNYNITIKWQGKTDVFEYHIAKEISQEGAKEII